MGTSEGVRRCFAYVKRALEFQPDFAAALALKADAHIYSAITGMAHPRIAMSHAIASVQQALRAAPKLASALTAKGAVQFAFQWDRTAAVRTLAYARELDASSDRYHFWSEAALAAEDPAAAAANLERYAEEDNCSAPTAYLASSYCYNAHEWKQTEYWARRAIELRPDYFRPYTFWPPLCWRLDGSRKR